jgi:hypothetical protein
VLRLYSVCGTTILRQREPFAKSMDSERDILNFLADFGETIALMPAMVAVCAYLLATGARRLALAWFLALVISIALTAALKSVLGPISGHGAISWAFYGGLAVLVWRTAPPASWLLRALAVVLVGLAGVVTWCVWMLGWHSTEEAIGGALLGSLSLLTFAGARPASLLPYRGALILLLIAVLSVAPLHGVRLKYPSAGGEVLTALAQQ